MNFKKIFFNENRTIKKDFENRNISQNSHNVEMIEAYIPKSLLAATSDYYFTVRISFELASGEAVNDKYMTLDSSYLDDEYYRYKCALSQGYTKVAGLLKMSIIADALYYSDPTNPIVEYSWVSAEFKLNVLKTASSNFEINQTFEAMLAEQVESDINANAANILKTNELIKLNDGEYAFIRRALLSANYFSIETLLIDNFTDSKGIYLTGSSADILDGFDEVNHQIDISDKVLVTNALANTEFKYYTAGAMINFEKSEGATIKVEIECGNGTLYPISSLSVSNNSFYRTSIAYGGNTAKLKITATGHVVLKNLAWGVGQYA